FNPKDHLVGVIDTRETVEKLFRELQDAGFSSEDVRVYTGEEGAEQIDPHGNEHGLVTMLKRFFQMTHVDFDFEHYYANEAAAGHYVVTVHCPEDEQRQVAQRLMMAHGSRNTHYFSTFQFEEIHPY